MTTVLNVTELHKKYGQLCAVDRVSFKLQKGQCLAILGPNGAGKTTTIEMLEGLTEPSAGQVDLLGMDLLKERTSCLEKMGVLLQETYLYKRYTVKETLELFASFYKNPLSPDSIIELMNLKDKADTQLRHLSGGQKQRVYIGSSLINNPEVIFLDEPTTGLDPKSRRSIWDLIEKLKAQGKSILLTTHYMDEAETLADQVAIMDKGRIICEGTPKDLIKKIAGEKVIYFDCSHESIQDPHELKDHINSKLGNADIHVDKSGFYLETKDPLQTFRTLNEDLPKWGCHLKELSMRGSTLEDVFLKLTGRSISDE